MVFSMVCGCSKISLSMKWAYPPRSICARSQSMCATFFLISVALMSITRYPWSSRTAISPSSR